MEINMTEILAPIFTIVIAYAVRAAFRFLKVEVDEKTFNAIVASIVVYLLTLIGAPAVASLF
jgi:hypothetical protein